VVTGGNRGIGLEICKQLAFKGVTIILTARDEKRGVEAVKNLAAQGLSNVLFHQLEVGDLSSTTCLADFIREKFGKLDILVLPAFLNNFPFQCQYTTCEGLGVDHESPVVATLIVFRSTMQRLPGAK
jgi:NAD(P)-dependent dehydrogenase (short-subunit alcohol dehydrogenase family)